MPKFILATFIITILAWATWTLTLFKLPPQTWYSYTLFFGTLFLGLGGLTSILLFTTSSFLQPPQRDHLPAPTCAGRQAGPSLYRTCLRHGALVAGLLAGLGIMRTFRVLTTLNGFLLLALAALGEMYISSPPSPKSRLGKSQTRKPPTQEGT